MASRPRLLFLCQNLPFPPDGGALIRSYHTLRLLSEAYDVTALCFTRARTRPTPEAVAAGVEGLQAIAESVEVFRIPQDGNRTRFVLDHARSVATRRAYTRWIYDSTACRQRIIEALKEKSFSIVHLDSLDLVAYLPLVSGTPVTVAHHNVESQLLRRRAESEKGLRRQYIRYQAELTRREERRWCPQVDLNVVVSDEDGATLREIAPGARTVVVPNGVDTTEFRPTDSPTRSGIVFVGGYTWFPNRDGMHYFADEIMPLILQRRPGTEVTWVGRASDEIRAKFADVGIHMTGYVDDIRPYVDSAACFIVPLRVGGGTRLKILDAWALGKAVVSTSQGAEGLAIDDGSNIAIADSPHAFAERVIDVLDDAEMRRRLEEGGRRTAVDFYDWEICGSTMLAAFDEIRTRAPTS